MHEIPVLTEFVKVLAMAALVVGIFHRLKLPSIAGFLVAGVLVGPGVTGLVPDRHNVEIMAELGVVLLLFSIGLEFSVRDMMRMRKLVFGGGLGQMLLTTLVLTGLLRVLGQSWTSALFLGSAMSLSSTAIVLKLLGDRGELGQVHGRFVLGTLLFQDLAVVFLMLLVPLLAGGGGDGAHGEGSPGTAALLWSLGKSLAAVVALLGVSIVVFPRLLHAVVAQRSSELFRIVTMLAVMGTAWIAGEAGLSLALGAFIAGMVIADSPYSHQMHAEVLPLRDVFNGVFFVSVGMLFDPTAVLAQPAEAAVLTVVVIGLKLFAAGGAARLLRMQRHEAWLAGASLAQVGEFAFVLVGKGLAAGLVDDLTYRTFVNVSVISMLLTPALIPLAHRLAPRLQGGAQEQALQTALGAVPDPGHGHAASDHVVIVGYGVKGQNVRRVLGRMGVTYRIAELNAHTVTVLREAGEPAVYGDASQPAVLESLGIRSARALVITVPDPSAMRAMVAISREMNPDLRIIVRTRYVNEVAPLIQLGANDVVAEEFETSLELAGHVMEAYGASSAVVEREKQELREEYYEGLRNEQGSPVRKPMRLQELLLHVDVDPIRVDADAGAVGMTLRALNLRALTGANVIAVIRNGTVIANPVGEFVIEAEDSLMVLGHGDQLQAAELLIQDPRVLQNTQTNRAITRSLRALTGALPAIPDRRPDPWPES